MSYTEHCGTFLETNAHARINSGPVLGTFYLRVGTMWVNVSSSSCPIGAWDAWYEYEMSNERKREFMASFISLIEDVAKSAIAGQPTS